MFRVIKQATYKPSEGVRSFSTSEAMSATTFVRVPRQPKLYETVPKEKKCLYFISPGIQPKTFQRLQEESSLL
ncbi:hypothetical protein ILYODFUR_021754 [Ilyodon furcidens]|uniref:Uncharacterized protein n=1 Tax=Ilyodon furcidens TaxID=33524 RepID=A0ABV0SZ23_9TELE